MSGYEPSPETLPPGVVAVISFPIPVPKLAALVKGLEAAYGKGLIFRPTGSVAQIVRPEPES